MIFRRPELVARSGPPSCFCPFRQKNPLSLWDEKEGERVYSALSRVTTGGDASFPSRAANVFFVYACSIWNLCASSDEKISKNTSLVGSPSLDVRYFASQPDSFGVGGRTSANTAFISLTNSGGTVNSYSR